ncbi:LytR/AlgR family response regulator transcription factor [Tenacibaculum aiptasiae]|uniref:Response regulator transcription factor n=1 Tax=Tenacibaculum aiptasiae TaxID=426481 RepID=A0A7J5AAT7_9FLAO|nr:LytTR family DNA-binding domain-containing protein [Tenacibaculum aiptasiae]KAB1154538.1 response regulator transcription factor [Tenacibaculum aiptasiae]
MRTCIIVEDQPPAQRILQKYINDVGSLKLLETFSDGIEALSFLQNEEVDLIFLDIHLPKISGIDFLKTLKNNSQVILTTAFSDYALESYEYNVVDYLLKPFSFQRFVQAIHKSTSMLSTKSEGKESKIVEVADTFLLKSGYDFVKVSSNDIIFIKSDADYTEIVTTEKTYLSSESMKNWLTKLPTSFVQIHKSYIVNTSYLEKVSGNQVYISNEEVLPLGRAYKEDFLQKFVKYK